MTKTFLLLVFFSAIVCVQCLTGSIKGTITSTPTFTTNSRCDIIVKIYQQETTSKDVPIRQNIGSLFQRHPIKLYSQSLKVKAGRNNVTVNYLFTDLAVSKSYFIIAELQTESKGQTLEKNIIGWYTDEKCSWLSYVKLTSENPVAANINIEIKGSIPPTQPKKIANGEIKTLKNITVVHLSGDEKQRGFAHGHLLAQQIVDFFRFFSLHSDIGSCNLYMSEYVPMIEESLSGSGGPFLFHEHMLIEIDSIIEGMKSNKDVDLYFPELGRNFSRIDLLAINAYIEFEYLGSQYLGMDSRSACSQFALWKSQTSSNPSLKGGIIGGRNMDGEIDYRHVTVSHFIMFAIEPSQGKRYVSFMWPGFVGTLSGINEDGIYNMMNFGISSSTHVQYLNATPVSWIVRNILTQPKTAEEATPEKVQSIIESFNAESGGPCVAGCILFTIKPYHAVSNNNNNNDIPSFVYEGDWKKGMMRLPGAVDPTDIDDVILATNHFHLYGVDNDTGPHYNFGRQMSFGSLWRYMAGNAKIQGYTRSPLYKGNINIEHLAELLRTVQHGSTEHAIIYNPLVDQTTGKLQSIRFHVALASTDSKTAWDGPYLGFSSFDFEELF